MKKTTFTEHQIISILKKQETGMKVADLCREHGISDATFYNWKAKYGGMELTIDQKPYTEIVSSKSYFEL